MKKLLLAAALASAAVEGTPESLPGAATVGPPVTITFSGTEASVAADYIEARLNYLTQ